MTKEKWTENFLYENSKRIYGLNSISEPKDWVKNRIAYMNFIEAMDDAFEVYNLENERK